MLDTFHGTLPGGKPQLYTRADTATFDQIYVVVEGLASECVKKHLVSEAGWSFAGKSAYCSCVLDMSFDLRSRKRTQKHC